MKLFNVISHLCSPSRSSMDPRSLSQTVLASWSLMSVCRWRRRRRWRMLPGGRGRLAVSQGLKDVFEL